MLIPLSLSALLSIVVGFNPTVFIGYLTTAPYAPRYVQIIESGLRDSVTSLDRYPPSSLHHPFLFFFPPKFVCSSISCHLPVHHIFLTRFLFSPHLSRYCLYILSKDLQQQTFFRVDKGNISDTEAQVAHLTLFPNNKPPQLREGKEREEGREETGKERR